MSRMPNKRDVQAVQPPRRRDADRVEGEHDTIDDLANEPLREDVGAGGQAEVEPAQRALQAEELTDELPRESEGAGTSQPEIEPAPQPLHSDDLTNDLPRETGEESAEPLAPLELEDVSAPPHLVDDASTDEAVDAVGSNGNHTLQPIPAEFRDLFDTRPVLVSLATVLADSQPHLNPVWIDMDGDYLRVNTVKGRQKYVNMVERPMVTIMAFDPEQQLRYAEVRGRVHHMTEEGGDAHIDSLAKKYLGVDVYPWHIAENTRVIVYIEPIKVLTSG